LSSETIRYTGRIKGVNLSVPVVALCWYRLNKNHKETEMKNIIALMVISVLAGFNAQAFADPDDREDRRDERGRSDERQDKRDCRQEEGAVGKDKRDCKQEEVRDGVRGNQGERLGRDND
jgi:hypothetical protein